ncbi:hypothetical protein G6011_00751 [Alternaria panax]|uniref:Uncharacterized protein n=1 Tax=Alternaria panax TaxID=48097 RepID=A0AAD4IJ73_9PLEO|nr:hypothetical protein G6011_00751 [Alternaria panax]
MTLYLTQNLGHLPKYFALAYPAIFNSSCKCAAYRAISTTPDDDDRPFRKVSGAAAACEAYDLFHPYDRLGRALQDCNDDEPSNLTIGIEYEQGYMHVQLFEMVYQWQGYSSSNGNFCRECGLHFEASQETSSYEDRIRVFLNDVVRNKLTNNKYCSKDDIWKVVVAGEVPRAAIAELGNLAQRTLRLDHIKTLNDIDAALVESYGAASFALHTQIDPGADGHRVYASPSPEEEHSEL